ISVTEKMITKKYISRNRLICIISHPPLIDGFENAMESKRTSLRYRFEKLPTEHVMSCQE
ncbi:MAG: hypothetical protein L6N96_00200, partial [Candidatus Methylarchaceae archaeon HK02M2]|nr:hypothetical protein [Candidatus Methylarchaceae archaeon HK02M2]